MCLSISNSFQCISIETFTNQSFAIVGHSGLVSPSLTCPGGLVVCDGEGAVVVQEGGKGRRREGHTQAVAHTARAHTQ